MEIPIWRVDTDGHGDGDWTLVAAGFLEAPPKNVSLGELNDCNRLWSEDIGSVISKEFSCSEIDTCLSMDSSAGKENFSGKLTGMGLLANNNSDQYSEGFSSKKRGILTKNSALCNGSTAADKRQRMCCTPPKKHGNVQTLFKTASLKPVQISSSGLQRAKALLRPDDVRVSTPGREELHHSSKVSVKVANTMENVHVRAEDHSTPAGGSTPENAMVCTSPTSNAGQKSALTNLNNELGEKSRQKSPRPLKSEDPCYLNGSPDVSTIGVPLDHSTPVATSCLFQTATGKAVSLSTSGMLQARKLFAIAENLNTCLDPPIGMFQTARGQSVVVSSTAMKQAAKLLGEENVSYPAEEPSFPPPISFFTAVGKPVSVSKSAIKRAKHLLGGDFENTEIRTTIDLNKTGKDNRQQLFETPQGHIIRVSSDSIERAKLLLKDEKLSTGIITCPRPNQISEFDSVKTLLELPSRSAWKGWCNNNLQGSSLTSESKGVALVRKSVASFKAPRRLQVPLHPASNSHCKAAHFEAVNESFPRLLSLHSQCKRVKPRTSLEEFFKEQPQNANECRRLTDDVKMMTSETAKTYRLSSTVTGIESVGSDDFRLMLLEAGAKSQVVNKEWVGNHYRWIVWKLASLERSFPSKVAHKLLTIQRVFDELKYRYEREVDGAHRSAIKKISEGDSVAGRMMILCVASIEKVVEQKGNNSLAERSGLNGDPQRALVEMTDGWYSLMAQVDQPLLRQLNAGKVFVGQKLRVCGATLFGCTTPMPPLEAFQVMKLQLHINGTYRARWMDKLGFCRGMPMPLAFHCIRPDGGLVPRTIIGIHRIYPVLYYERLPNGGSITRSARAEDFANRGYLDRRIQVAEDAIMKMERECIPHVIDNGIDEGAKLFKLLETSAEPELLMAEMSAAQHAAFAAFQARREAATQCLAQKKILKALGEVNLDAREVTPFIKISVTGVYLPTNETKLKREFCGKNTKGGLVTVWHATEEKVDGLKEGAVYCVSNLSPLTGTNYAQVKNSLINLRTTKLSDCWQLLPQASFPDFSPRKALPLSMLGTLPFRSEFDVAVLVIHVGRPYACGFYKKQWLFGSDGSWEEQPSKESKKVFSLLAIDLSTSNDAFVPVERTLEGGVIGYCNLVKRCRDQKNSMWVAEASETSVFSSSLSGHNFLHLKAAADLLINWAKSSKGLIAELEERVYKVVGQDL